MPHALKRHALHRTVLTGYREMDRLLADVSRLRWQKLLAPSMGLAEVRFLRRLRRDGL